MFIPHYVSHVTCHVSHVTCHGSRVTCHVSRVTCHVSRVTCHVSRVKMMVFTFFIYKKKLSLKKNWTGGRASPWRVCYHQGIPRLVFYTWNSFHETIHATLPWYNHVVGALQALARGLSHFSHPKIIPIKSLKVRTAETFNECWNGNWQMVRSDV